MKRNFIRGMMDGSLTTIGVLIASFKSPEVLAAAGLGVAVANSISNACGGYVSEKSDKIHEHKAKEKAMLITRGLAKTVHMTRAEIESLKRGLMDSAGTFVGAIIPVSCVLIAKSMGMLLQGLIIGTIIPVCFYVFLGIWMGLHSREHLAVSAMKTTFFALATVAFSYLIQVYV